MKPMLGKSRFSVVLIVSGAFAGLLGVGLARAAQAAVTSADPKGQLGNVEEHFYKGPDGKDVSWFSVVWFENPLKTVSP